MGRRVHLSWKGYRDFSKENVVHYVTQSPGVYKLSLKLKNGNLKPFYVGQASDLRSRLLQHLATQEQDQCVRSNVRNYIVHFNWAVVDSKASRDCAETALFDHYSPECNNIRPGSQPCEINTN